MSEHEGEPQAADVRSFLPRPGEPVEDYAARLRALHHDLTLVLDAVERGLAAAERSPLHEVAAEPEPVAALADPAPEPHRSPPPFAPFSTPVRAGARVEVVTTGHDARSGPPEPTGATSTAEAVGRPAPMGERAPDGGNPAALSPERLPWVDRPPHELREGGWADASAWDAPAWERSSAWPPPPPPPREMSFDPPFAMSRRRRAPTLSPVLLAATVLGWLTVVALILALALD